MILQTLRPDYSIISPYSSRHALLTGKYPHTSGMQHGVLGEDTPYCSPVNNKFLGERFQDVGYTTYAVGK
jgi:arylsulfatase A-like enzyme